MWNKKKSGGVICFLRFVYIGIMTEDLYMWLQKRWKLDNHNKYHYYFKEWVDNITDTQIQGFNKMEKRRNVYEC